MESRKEYIKALIKWGVLSLIVGTLCGIIGSAFHIGVSFATGFREEYPFLLYFLPVAGLAIVGIYQLFRLEGQNTNAVISEVHS